VTTLFGYALRTYRRKFQDLHLKARRVQVVIEQVAPCTKVRL